MKPLHPFIQPNATHYVIDWETLALTPDARVYAVAVVKVFQPWVGVELVYSASISPSYQECRIVTEATFNWWRQAEQAEADTANCALPRRNIRTVLAELSALFWHDGNNPYLWGNSAVFDLGLLEHLLGDFPITRPKHSYRKLLCLKTLGQTLDPDETLTQVPKLPHYCVVDALASGQYLQNLFQRLS